MDAVYRIDRIDRIVSPALVVFRELVEENLDRMLRIAGDPVRLRPHCKTHKMADVIRMQLRRVITKHKCATLAEAEMLARTGVNDVFLAYPVVGPNVRRVAQFRETYPNVTLSVTGDDPAAVKALGEEMCRSGRTIEVLLDLDVGQHRTGIAVGDRAHDFYRLLVETPGIEAGGLHVYDGHNHQVSPERRGAAVREIRERVDAFRASLISEGWAVPRINAGGTGTFGMFARWEVAGLELSPGTCVFHDAGYRDNFPDLDFRPAALLVTRVISRPTDRRVTLDLGNKAVASDPAVDRRVVVPELPDAVPVIHNEEHLVVETSHAACFRPGDALLAIPWHICPTSALYKEVYVVAGGRVTDRWTVTARDRMLTI